MISPVRVLESWAETPTVHAVRFEKPNGFSFRPVQFCGLELATDEGGIEYSMSLACAPTRPFLEFGARIASGTPWKRAFQRLRPGDEAEVDGPYGRFVLDEARPAVLLAGGIGITPLKGMMQYAADRDLDLQMRLLYSNRSVEEIAYRAEIEQYTRQNRRLKVAHTLTGAHVPPSWPGFTGRIDEKMIATTAGGLREPCFYVCGLPAMVEDLVRLLRTQGIPCERVRFEEFWGYEAS